MTATMPAKCPFFCQQQHHYNFPQDIDALHRKAPAGRTNPYQFRFNAMIQTSLILSFNWLAQHEVQFTKFPPLGVGGLTQTVLLSHSVCNSNTEMHK